MQAARPGGCAESPGAAGCRAQLQPFTLPGGTVPCHWVGRYLLKYLPSFWEPCQAARPVAAPHVGDLLLCTGSKCCKMETGVHWGLLVLDAPRSLKGSGFNWSVKQPWSCGVERSEPVSWDLRALRSLGVPPCHSPPSWGADPGLGDAGLCPCDGIRPLQGSVWYLATHPGPPAFPPSPRQGVCRSGSAKPLLLVVLIWGPWHGQGCLEAAVAVTAHSGT